MTEAASTIPARTRAWKRMLRPVWRRTPPALQLKLGRLAYSAWGLFHLPDYPGALVAYVPSLRWAYSGPAATPLYFDMVVARIRDRGWAVDRIGSIRSLVQPIPARTASR